MHLVYKIVCSDGILIKNSSELNNLYDNKLVDQLLPVNKSDVIYVFNENLKAVVDMFLQVCNLKNINDIENAIYNMNYDIFIDFIILTDKFKLKEIKSLCKKYFNEQFKKPVDEIRKAFNLVDDISPDELKEIKLNSEWNIIR